MIDVRVLIFDDENEAKLAANHLTIDEVQEVKDKWPRYYRNRPERRASHVMVGPTARGRMLVVPIEPFGRSEGVWRPVTGFEAAPGQAARYRSRK
jgi:hypothetical protein